MVSSLTSPPHSYTLQASVFNTWTTALRSNVNPPSEVVSGGISSAEGGVGAGGLVAHEWIKGQQRTLTSSFLVIEYMDLSVYGRGGSTEVRCIGEM